MFKLIILTDYQYLTIQILAFDLGCKITKKVNKQRLKWIKNREKVCIGNNEIVFESICQ